MSVVATLVVSFGQSAATASGSIVAEWDDSLNLDADGEVKNQFVPGDIAWLLVHHDNTVEIVDVKSTAGSLSSSGAVNLSRSQEVGFGSTDDTQSLSYLPAARPSLSWFGRVGSGMVVTGRELTIGANFPCLAKATFPVAFTRYRLQTPSMELSGDEEFPLRIYIYYREVSS